MTGPQHTPLPTAHEIWWAKHSVKIMAYYMSRQVYLEAQLHCMLAFTKTFLEKNGEINRAV
jgi:hypothetical protein